VHLQCDSLQAVGGLLDCMEAMKVRGMGWVHGHVAHSNALTHQGCVPA
jgi:hypothetical protein